MLFKVFHNVAMCSRSLKTIGVKDIGLSFEVSGLFPLLKIDVMFASFQALGTRSEVLGGRHVCLESMVECHLVHAI